ncbi:MAG: Fic family protein [Spirochaetaceae bacterium]|jgi:Fic family protein|nr:Fic family protein [Spirochaetaceae bacterium]
MGYNDILHPNQKLDLGFETNQAILRLIAGIDRYRGEWSVLEKTRDNRTLRELRKIAAPQSIGYYDALELIYKNYTDIKLSENYVEELHQILIKHSARDTRYGGYKSLSGRAVYSGGSVFADPRLTETGMSAIFQWTNLQFEEQKLHPLLVIALFIYEFLSIHPFQNGNCRLSQLLATLCLLRSGYSFIQYVPVGYYIVAHKKEYYDAIMAGQRKRGTEDEKIGQWLFFFLEGLTTLTEKLDKKYKTYKAAGPYLNGRQKRIQDFIAERQPVKFADIALGFPDIPAGTLKKDLQYLRGENAAVMMGSGRGSIYMFLPVGESLM